MNKLNTIKSWAHAELYDWARLSMSIATYKSQCVFAANASLSRFMFDPNDPAKPLKDCNAPGLDAETKGVVDRHFRSRADCFAAHLSEALINLGTVALPIVIDVADQCGDSREFPIFSFQRTIGSKIILLPDIDFLVNDFYRDYPRDEQAFLDKRTAACFSGSTTGGGLIDEGKLSQNLVPRVRSARYFANHSEVSFKLPSLVECTEAARAILLAEGFGGARVPWNEQTKSKLLLSMDGHGATCSRVYLGLSSKCALLKYASEHELYYFKSLAPWVHYLPISSDEDVISAIDIEQSKPGFLLPIAEEGRNFADDFLDRQSVISYTTELMIALRDIIID